MRPNYWLYSLSKNSNAKKIFIIYSVVVIIFAVIKPLLFMDMSTIFTKLCLVPAGIWSIWGPYLIVKFYDRYYIIISKLLKHDLISHTPIVQNGFKYNKNMNVIISAIWILMLLSILLIFPQSLEFLGIYGYKDIWYWLFIIVTIYLLQITATGFSGVISSILLIYKLNNKILEGNKTYLYILLEEDKEVADKLVGFCFASSLYFSSGVLFVPTLLVYMNNSNSYIAHIFVLFAIILYSIFILLAYLIPLFIMEGNIKKYKTDKIDEIKRKYENVVQKNEHLRIVSYYLQMKYVDDENIMPESLERMLKIFTVAIIPILAFVINNIAIIQDIIKFINTHVKV